MNQYWIVIGDTPAKWPRRHPSFESAHNEAIRLARANRGTAFTVFRALEVSVASDIVTTALKASTEEQEIPF